MFSNNVDFNSPTWKYIETEIAKSLDQQSSVCTNFDKSYKELLRAQGAVAAYKTVLNLPQIAQSIAATQRG